MARITGDAELRVNLQGLSRDIEDSVFRAVYAAADTIATEAAQSIVRGSISGAGHVPSAPGDPPNADTRQLDTSIVTQPDRPRMAARAIAQAPYAAALEYGTVKMAARPFMRPALKKQTPEAVALIRQAVARATSKPRGAP